MTARAKHGLVIGKFYPPHAGHHLLVRAAAKSCERVTVAVLAASVESIPLEHRVAWMREVHAPDTNVTIVGGMDDVPVNYDDDAIWAAHVDIMRSAVASVTREPVDAVFSSEPYGQELARRFGARNVCVDVGRVLAPVSGTAVRRDPIAHWELVAPPVRAYLARRIVLVGAESTGKTTLAQALRDALCARGGPFASTQWVPEVGRDWSVEKLLAEIGRAALEGRPRPALDDVTWTRDEFTGIARAQCEAEDAAARRGGPVLVCDTDAFATAVWHERYLGARSPEVEAIAARYLPALYLVTHHDDVPFHQDGVRDGEHIRAWMTGRFLERLKETGRPHVILRGTSVEERVRAALREIDAVLARGWSFAAPLG